MVIGIYNKAASLELKPGYKASRLKKNIIVEEVDTKIIPHGKMGNLFLKNTQFKTY
jgi:hypothetical protein